MQQADRKEGLFSSTLLFSLLLAFFTCAATLPYAQCYHSYGYCFLCFLDTPGFASLNLNSFLCKGSGKLFRVFPELQTILHSTIKQLLKANSKAVVAARAAN